MTEPAVTQMDLHRAVRPLQARIARVVVDAARAADDGRLDAVVAATEEIERLERAVSTLHRRAVGLPR